MIAAASRSLLAAVFTLSLGAAAMGQDTLPAGDPVKGQKQFMASMCYECHGTFGQGAGRAGPRIAPHALPPNLILRQLRHPSAQMPVYTPAVLSDAQAADIIAYLESIKPGKPAKDIPILNVP